MARTTSLRLPSEPGRAAIRRAPRWLVPLLHNPLSLAGGAILLVLALAGAFAPLLAPANPVAVHMTALLQPPSAAHWFGTDNLGRDLLSRTLYGARISLTIGFVVVLTSGAVGSMIGLVSGFFGGIVDLALMRLADMFLAFPSLILAMALAAALGPSLTNAMVAIAITAWPGYARLIRSVTLSLKEQEFVAATRAIGAGEGRILFRHVLPNTLSPLIVNATMSLGTAILVAAGLSFIGFGAQPPTPEWGAMVAAGRNYVNSAWWVATIPGLAILLAVIGFSLLGDALRDILDPRMRWP